MTNRHLQFAAWIALAAIAFATISPIQMRPGDVFSADADRALAFGLLSAAFMVAYPRRAFAIGLFVILAGGGFELLQMLSPSRHATLDDAITKTAGAGCGMMLALVYNAFKKATPVRYRAVRLVSTRNMGQMTPLSVSSSMIKAVYFSREDGKLRIRMRNGEERLFSGVSEKDAISLVTAASPGTYYMEQIRTKFPRLAA
jgi:hypothetical protein